MAASRLLRISRPFVFSNHAVSSVESRHRTLMCLNKVGLNSDNTPGGGGGERKPVVVKAASCTPDCVLVSEPKMNKGVNLARLLAYVADVMSRWRDYIIRPRPWSFHIQMFIEKAIIDCRFFTLLAVAGSLVGSTICFIEGCYLIVVSYLQTFHLLSQIPEQGHVVFQLIEAIDMFLIGTSMLVFAMALHVMFVGQNNIEGKASNHAATIFPNNINLKKLPAWIGMQSAVQAKSKMGHTLIMILQIQLVDKFKSIAVINGIDLACFAGAIFLSSVTIFLLSRISFTQTTT